MHDQHAVVQRRLAALARRRASAQAEPSCAARPPDAATRRLLDNSTNAHRRIARDLHDGVQQRLVNLFLALRTANDEIETDAQRAHELLDHASYHARAAIEELREVVAGIHPAILTTKGLLPALKSLAFALRGANHGCRTRRRPPAGDLRGKRLLLRR